MKQNQPGRHTGIRRQPAYSRRFSGKVKLVGVIPVLVCGRFFRCRLGRLAGAFSARVSTRRDRTSTGRQGMGFGHAKASHAARLAPRIGQSPDPSGVCSTVRRITTLYAPVALVGLDARSEVAFRTPRADWHFRHAALLVFYRGVGEIQPEYPFDRVLVMDCFVNLSGFSSQPSSFLGRGGIDARSGVPFQVQCGFFGACPTFVYDFPPEMAKPLEKSGTLSHRACRFPRFFAAFDLDMPRQLHVACLCGTVRARLQAAFAVSFYATAEVSFL